MADDKKVETTPEEDTGKPASSSRKAIAKDYAESTPKDRLKKFVVDPSTKTLKRA